MTLFPPLQNQNGTRIGHVIIYVETDAPIRTILQSLEEKCIKLEEYSNYKVGDKEIETLAIDCKATTRQLLNLLEINLQYSMLIIQVLESLELIHDKLILIGNNIDSVIRISNDFADLLINFMHRMCGHTLNERMVFTILSYEWALKNDVLRPPHVYPVSFGGMADEKTYIFSPSEIEKFFDDHRVKAVNKILDIFEERNTEFYSTNTKILFKIYRKLTGRGNNNASLLDGII